MNTLQHHTINTNGIRMHYVRAGKGPLVVLLHGFPEFWYAWRHQIPALAEHFTVIAPDLRGYGSSEKPSSVADYKMNLLEADIVGLIKGLEFKKAHIVGHDWGGAIAWRLAMHDPSIVDHLAVINSPHPKIFKEALRSNWTQIKKSWYFFYFQIPYIPDYFIKARLKSIMEGIFKAQPKRKGAFTDEDIAEYVGALSQPGAITAALNYYRAAFRYGSKEKHVSHGDSKISAPTLVIWGENDKALGKELSYNMEPFFSGSFKIEYIPNCSHWVNEEQPELVNKLILQFLQNKE